MRWFVLALTLLMALAVFAAPRTALADPQTQFELARTRWENGRIQQAAEILGPMLSVPITGDDPEAEQRREVYLKARPYYVACLLALESTPGIEETIDEQIMAQYRADPFFELPPGQFPQAVSDRFIEVAQANRQEIEDLQSAILQSKAELAAERARIEKAKVARLLELERLAAEEKVTIERSRVLALIPFGVGQFQNDDVGLGIFFLTSEVLTIATSIASGVIWQDTTFARLDNCKQPSGDVDCAELEARFDAARAVNYTSFGVSMALIAAGIIEAQISFEGTTTVTKKRDIPPRIEAEPTVSATSQGFVLGVRGQF